MKNKSSILWSLGYLKGKFLAMILLTLSNIGSALLGVAFALGTRQVIDSAISGVPDVFLRACLIQAGIILSSLVLLILNNHLHDRLSQILDLEWKQRLFKLLLHGKYTSVTQYHSAELLNRMNNDVATMNDGLLTILPNLCSMVTRLLAAFIVLLRLEPFFTLLLMAAGATIILCTTLIRRRLKGMQKQVSESNGFVSGYLQEALEKLLMVQAMDVSEEVEARSDKLLNTRLNIHRRQKNVSLFANSCVRLTSYAVSFAALVWCSFGLLRGYLSFGSLTAVTQLVSQLQGPFVGLSSVIPQYVATTAAAERLMELTEIPQEPALTADSAALYKNWESICGDEICFSYDRDIILKNSHFRIPKGSFTVITGPSGTGKSTLLKLLLGILEPEKGKMYVQGPDECFALNQSTRHLFAYVPQGNLLLSGTLLENLTLTNPGASQEQISQALYVSAMDDYVPQLPLGLNTELGESGFGLSEGQAQRLAIARAILGGAPVLLLDESTSALDAKTEETILRRIKELPDRTCIAVTHRSAAIELCTCHLEIDEYQIKQKK